MHCRMFSSIPRLHPLTAISAAPPPVVTAENLLQTLPRVPRKAGILPVENQSSTPDGSTLLHVGMSLSKSRKGIFLYLGQKRWRPGCSWGRGGDIGGGGAAMARQGRRRQAD